MSLPLSEAVKSYAPAETDAAWRLDPKEAEEAIKVGAYLVDIRSVTGRTSGTIPNTLQILRLDLPEAFSEQSSSHDPALTDGARTVILFCTTGQGSYPSAAALREHGFTHVTDLRGGFVAWKEAGLPAENVPAA